MDVHIRQLYMQFLSGQDAGSGPAPFFQMTPPPPPPPPQAPVPMQMQRVWAGNAFGLAPGEGSLTAGGDAFLGDDQLVDGFEEDTLALMRMTADELSAFLSDGPGVDPLCVPPEFPMGSLDQTAMTDSPSVPAAGGASQSASGSLGLGAAQARASDSPASGVVDPLTRMSQTSSGSPVLGSAQARASGSPASGVVDPLTRMSGDGLSAFMSDGAAVNSLCMPPECPMSSLVAYQPAMDDSPPVPPAGWSNESSSGSPGLGCAQARATDSPAAYLDAPQQVPDSETAEVARMVRVAERCGDRPSTSWSVEEDQLLIQGLSRFAGQDNVIRCFSIASQLEEKTALDVAYRIRWLTDLEKKKAAKEVQLGQEKPGGGNVTKGKGTKVANKKNNKHPPSKEALDSRSAKDIIRDNNRLMDKIEEILRTGEVNNCPDYFYYVKMNMDAMQNKVKDLGSVMEGISVGDAEWEDVLKDRHDTPQAGEDAATPAP